MVLLYVYTLSFKSLSISLCLVCPPPPLSFSTPLLSSLNWNRWSINYALKYTEDQLWSTRLQPCRSPHPHLSINLSLSSSWFFSPFHSCLWIAGVYFHTEHVSGSERGFCFRGTLPLFRHSTAEKRENPWKSRESVHIFLLYFVHCCFLWLRFEWKAQGE